MMVIVVYNTDDNQTDYEENIETVVSFFRRFCEFVCQLFGLVHWLLYHVFMFLTILIFGMGFVYREVWTFGIFALSQVYVLQWIKIAEAFTLFIF